MKARVTIPKESYLIHIPAGYVVVYRGKVQKNHLLWHRSSGWMRPEDFEIGDTVTNYYKVVRPKDANRG